MSAAFFIARRYFSSENSTVAGPIVRIAVWSIILGIAIMILSLTIVRGFKAQISEKVTGFGAHIQVNSFDLNQSFEPTPVQHGDSLLRSIKQKPFVQGANVFALKPGIAKADDIIEGIVLKGVPADYDWSFFEDKLLYGSIPTIAGDEASNDIMISSTLANRIKTDTGSTLFMYFVQDPPRVRRFKISGIYSSGLEELDRLYVFGDVRHIRKLNDWPDDWYSGIEIFTKDFGKVNEARELIEEELPPELEAVTVNESYPQIFDWLNLQDTNEKVILGLMLMVAIINMITALLILILDKTLMIGVLKSLGMSNSQVRGIFLYKAGYLVIRGLFWGNLLGLGLAFFQQQTGFFTLDEKSYYLSTIPVQIEFIPILLLNIGFFLFCMLSLLIPAMLISRISPVNAIRFS